MPSATNCEESKEERRSYRVGRFMRCFGDKLTAKRKHILPQPILRLRADTGTGHQAIPVRVLKISHIDPSPKDAVQIRVDVLGCGGG